MKGIHSGKIVRHKCEGDSKQDHNQPLLNKLQGLISSLTDCKDELEKCGVETLPVVPSGSLLSRLEVIKKHISGEVKNHKDSTGSEVLSDDVLQDITEYLREMVGRLVKQGKKLNEQAIFLQRTGKQFGRNHQSFLEEQAMLEQAIERAQQQLTKEKVYCIIEVIINFQVLGNYCDSDRCHLYFPQQDLEQQKEHLQVASEQLQALLGDHGHQQFGRHNKMSSPHTIARGKLLSCY